MQGNTSHGKEWNKKAHHKTRENRVLPTDKHHQFEITALSRSDYGVKTNPLRRNLLNAPENHPVPHFATIETSKRKQKEKATGAKPQSRSKHNVTLTRPRLQSLKKKE